MDLDDGEMNRLLRALADTTRRRIIEELGKREGQSLFELYTRVITAHGVGQSRQGFSRNLATLEKAGLITVEWRGVTKLHRLDTAPLKALGTGWLSRFGEQK